MENLTPKQQATLNALLVELEKLPTPELIAESARLRLPLLLDEAGKRRMRPAFGGAIAAQKLLSYIEALEEVDDHRGAIGRQIFELHWEGARLKARQSLAAAEPLVKASHLAGRQEVDFHFFSVCVGRIERLLPIAAKAAGHKVPKQDREFLAPYRALRDYYEHLEDRLPGGKNYSPSVSEIEIEGEWRFQMGLTLDAQQRIILGDVAVDVSPRGVATVRAVLRRNWEQLAPSALALVRKHFEAEPSDIPGPEAVNRRLLVSTGGV